MGAYERFHKMLAKDPSFQQIFYLDPGLNVCLTRIPLFYELRINLNHVKEDKASSFSLNTYPDQKKVSKFLDDIAKIDGTTKSVDCYTGMVPLLFYSEHSINELLLNRKDEELFESVLNKTGDTIYLYLKQMAKVTKDFDALNDEVELVSDSIFKNIDDYFKITLDFHDRRNRGVRNILFPFKGLFKLKNINDSLEEFRSYLTGWRIIESAVGELASSLDDHSDWLSNNATFDDAGPVAEAAKKTADVCRMIHNMANLSRRKIENYYIRELEDRQYMVGNKRRLEIAMKGRSIDERLKFEIQVSTNPILFQQIGFLPEKTPG